MAQRMTYVRDEQGYPIPQPPKRMTEKAFLAWTAAEDVRVEWADGLAYHLIPPSRRHQEMPGFLMRLVGPYVVSKDLGKVIPARFEMRLREGQSYRQPDLLFVAKEHEHRLGDGKRLDGPADLAVEIVGEDTADQDLRVKFIEYAELGVEECWTVDPRPGMSVFRAFARTEEGRFEAIAPGADGLVRSRMVPGFWIGPRWLGAGPLPDAFDILVRIMPPEPVRASAPDWSLGLSSQSLFEAGTRAIGGV